MRTTLSVRPHLESSPVSDAPLPPLQLADVQRSVAEELDRIAPVIDELGRRFADAGHELSLVGGPVRDAMLGRRHNDLDFTTSARPEQTERLLKGWADAIWDMGRAFGTIGCRRGPWQVEITTYRSEAYDPSSRKPDVDFGDSLDGDLGRRDFTVNAMAVRLPGRQVEDPYGGVVDLAHRVLRTPGRPEDSFSDDPLRMMRAARFAAQLGFTVDDGVREAMTAMADRISIISAERVRDELVKLVCAPYPRLGLTLLVETGLAALVLPELPALMLERDEHHRHKDVYEHTLTVLEQAIDLEDRLGGEPDFVSRFAALMHDVGKPRTRRFLDDGTVTFHHHDVVGAKITRKRMQALRFSNDEIEAVTSLVELHLRFHGYGSGEWTDSAVRRYVRDAGDQLERLHVLTRADCTTRNQRKAARLARTYDELEERIARLSEQEELASIRPDLDGNQIMGILGIGPGREIGEAYRHLLELRMDHGPLGEERAREELLAWWAARSA
ncbi:CCA tRNA nucleotidyltransferase [Nocardioides sp. zg-578]|uniref:CCA tRNA nucleotidyltransferase n=1 Tax=Nocardioides marmotae TaxID=2663857 RepID=A0A6I3JDP3_9ACTN|nr:CCA tRNA nucleotidyltransferase [Nocardioides marmotae]MCR6032645.1 CCA tRNA nucleotidyltransferase [Gordonia jinghuaiqii]MTB83517.1 CCA tRNA nucleotidyltransferase [Nocardioides marmotae]MTB96294.1 CCA tRNA nucleotidyltransferase [Nocardioides marmotae]QKE03216.1 CCA tRNA nucleotidyltransferase [Nocardioides marmotae]